MSKFLIVGGGIIGTALARELALRKAGEITVLEKEDSLGRHASGRNSAVIHSGINQKPGTLKAEMCVEGSRLLRQYCRERQIPMNERGTFVIARTSHEISKLEELLEMGKTCKVPGLRMLTQEELRQKEPAVKAIAALFSPTGATVNILKLLESLAEEARSNGVKFAFRSEVIGMNEKTVMTKTGSIQADVVINCAGLQADRLAHSMKVGLDYKIIPFRGEYMEVKNCDIHSMVYQPPDLRFPFLKIHLTRETDGSVLAGPSATLSFGRESYNKEWNFSDMAEMFLSSQFFGLLASRTFLGMCFENAAVSLSKRAFLKQVNSLAENVRLSDISPYRAGIRAQVVDRKGKFVNDILICKTDSTLHVLNAVSPGFTSSLAFAKYLVDHHLN